MGRTDAVEIGVGGSIPFIATFQEMFPQAAILVTGVEDPHARAHGPNESLHLGEFARVCLAERCCWPEWLRWVAGEPVTSHRR